MSSGEQSPIRVEEIPLPPKNLRWGGPRYRDDDQYIKAARSSVKTLQPLCGLSAETRLLDIGCGQAKLLTGLLATYGGIREYVGLDVHKPSIDWASTNLGRGRRGIAFHHLPVLNERYNPQGEKATTEFALPVAPDHFDIITLISVFSHMKLPEIQVYLWEIRRALAPSGKVFLTLFVEFGVQDEEENPPDYYREWTGPLHCIRLNRQRFEELVYSSGLIVDYFRYRHTHDGQSSYVLSRNDAPAFRAKIVT